jgi:dTMP kinase
MVPRMLKNFITFEGLDGSGKTSIINYIKPYLEKFLKRNIIFTREPIDSFKSLLYNEDGHEFEPLTQSLIYTASRYEHLTKTVLPAIAKNQIVICDRYIHSSIAYQGHAQKVGI